MPIDRYFDVHFCGETGKRLDWEKQFRADRIHSFTLLLRMVQNCYSHVNDANVIAVDRASCFSRGLCYIAVWEQMIAWQMAQGLVAGQFPVDFFSNMNKPVSIWASFP